LVAAAIFGALLLAWFVWRGWEWPPAHKVASPRARMWFNRAMLLFALTLSAIVALRLVQRFEMISDFTGMVVGALLGVAFFTAAIPLIWYRLRHGMGNS
jgi:Ca2+/H+ antiporter